MEQPLSISMIVSDDREVHRHYSSLTPFFGAAPGALLEGLAQLSEVQVHIVSVLQNPVNSPAKLAANIYYHPLIVPKWGWLRGAYLGCLYAIRRKLRQLAPALVHGQGTERYCSLAAAYSGFANIITIHGNMRRIARLSNAKPFTFEWLTARLEGFVLPRSDGVICVSTHARREVEALARRTWVVPNAVEASLFAVQRTPGDEPILLCPATVYRVKNQVGLICALDPLAQKRRFKLVFLGRADPAHPYTREFLHLVANRSWCVYEGLADRAQVKSHLARASVLVLPSFEENCPMAILEAMAAGVPVVAANVGGVPDLIEHMATGLLCNPADLNDICGTVSKLLDDENLRMDLAHRAKIAAASRFHPAVVARRHVEIYHELLALKATNSRKTN